jgi:sulfofructose kinase
VGLSCLDYRFQLSDPLSSGQRRYPARSYRESLGGPAAVAAQTVVRLGGQAALWSRRGDDIAGHKVAQLLEAAGVDIADYRVFAGAQSAVCAVVIAPGGERLLVPFWGNALPDEPDWLPVEKLRSAKALLIDTRWPAGALRAAKVARERELRVIIDVDRNTTEPWQLLERATHVIADEDFAKNVGGAAELIRHLQHMGKWAAVTLGPGGVVHPGGHLPAFAVQVRDSTGAGDVFHGAFALAIAGGQSEEDAVRFAAAAGALRCQLGDVPDRAQVLEMLQLNKL